MQVLMKSQRFCTRVANFGDLLASPNDLEIIIEILLSMGMFNNRSLKIWGFFNEFFVLLELFVFLIIKKNNAQELRR